MLPPPAMLEGPQHPDCNCQWGPPRAGLSYQLRSSLNREEYRMARTKPHYGMKTTHSSLDGYVKQNAGAVIALPPGTTLKCDAGVLILVHWGSGGTIDQLFRGKYAAMIFTFHSRRD